MDVTIEEMKKYLLVDRNGLDEACTNQADIFFRVSEKAVYAASEKDEAKDNLSVVGAEVATRIRQEAKDAGEKITEAKIGQTLVLSDEYKEAHQVLIEANKNAELWKVMKESFLQRSSMIKALCQLFIENYYADITMKSAEVGSGDVGYDKNRSKVADRKAKRRNNDD